MWPECCLSMQIVSNDLVDPSPFLVNSNMCCPHPHLPHFVNHVPSLYVGDLHPNSSCEHFPEIPKLCPYFSSMVADWQFHCKGIHMCLFQVNNELVFAAILVQPVNSRYQETTAFMNLIWVEVFARGVWMYKAHFMNKIKLTARRIVKERVKWFGQEVPDISIESSMWLFKMVGTADLVLL